MSFLRDARQLEHTAIKDGAFRHAADPRAKWHTPTHPGGTWSAPAHSGRKRPALAHSGRERPAFAGLAAKWEAAERNANARIARAEPLLDRGQVGHGVRWRTLELTNVGRSVLNPAPSPPIPG